eukprot:g14922.t1
MRPRGDSRLTAMWRQGIESETSALTLTWTMYFLAKHPEAFSRCRAEALLTAPLRPFFPFAVRSDGVVSTTEQLSKLEFCSAVFKEALRLKTPAPLTSFYATVKLDSYARQTMLLAFGKKCLRKMTFVEYNRGGLHDAEQHMANAEATIIIGAICAGFGISMAPGQMFCGEESRTLQEMKSQPLLLVRKRST